MAGQNSWDKFAFVAHQHHTFSRSPNEQCVGWIPRFAQFVMVGYTKQLIFKRQGAFNKQNQQ